MTTTHDLWAATPRLAVPRTTGVLLIAGGGAAAIGNVLHPRFRGEDVDIYSRIASSTRLEVADIIILVALLLVTLGFVGLADSLADRTGVARLGRLATVMGATVAIIQTAVELVSLRQQARVFASAAPSDHVGAFWSTVAVDKLNSALLPLWILVLLGLAPLALAYTSLSTRTAPRVLSLIGMLGGAGCVGVAVFDLLASDQSSADLPFLVASLLVTAWILLAGVTLLRPSTQSDLSNIRSGV